MVLRLVSPCPRLPACMGAPGKHTTFPFYLILLHCLVFLYLNWYGMLTFLSL